MENDLSADALVNGFTNTSLHTEITLDGKKIIAVIDTTFAVVKRKPEKKNPAYTGDN